MAADACLLEGGSLQKGTGMFQPGEGEDEGNQSKTQQN